MTDVSNIRDQLLASCATDLRWDLYRYIGNGVDVKYEVELHGENNFNCTEARENLQILSGEDSGLDKCVQAVSFL